MATFGELLNNESIRNLKKVLDQEVDEKKIATEFTKGLAEDLKKTFGSDTVKISGTGIDIAYKILSDDNNQSLKFFDLKPYFQQSAKAKTTKDGGWYLRVPISHLASTYRKAYGSKEWDIISHVQFGTTTGQNANRARFQKILSNAGGLNGTSLGYQWKSTSITRVPSANGGNRGSYINFRTVSNRSDPNSWYTSRSILENRIMDATKTEEEARLVASIIKKAVDHVTAEYNFNKD